ncbi:MAG: PD40 domain-containing protein [Verrucomicrobiae bacterium]|nr:PD40 domain-containing protein [Verrucomicrobiae bacterium]
MRPHRLPCWCPARAAAVFVLATLGAGAIDPSDTRLASDPAVSATHLAFAYANDLWIAAPDGAQPRRLTTHPGIESGPVFSPDGSLVAFTGRYEGNTDVYVVPSSGGVPRRLTWHPGDDIALGFTPDGRSILFSSAREVYTGRYTQLFTVPVEGGFPARLPIPNASRAAIAPDGRTIAYVPLAEPFRQWKHYRGGRTSRILLFDTTTHEVEQVPQPQGRCNDTDPMWLGDRLCFRSDRDGEFNLFTFDPAHRAVTRLTHHADFPVLGASAGGGRIAYEQAGSLHLFQPDTSESTRLRLALTTDLLEVRPRWASGTSWLRGYHPSPSGNRLAIEFRGEILTLPREKGEDRNLTQSPGTHDRSPAWSPDGRWIAWFSDTSGNYDLHIAPQDGQGPTRILPLRGPGFYANPKWSPDSRRISFTDNAHSIHFIDLATAQQTRVSTDAIFGPAPALHHAWSPDSRWIAHTRNTPTYHQQIFLFSVADGRSFAVTDGLADAHTPVFDPDGRFLYFLVSTDAGPVRDWFSQASADMRAVQRPYLAVLPRDVPSPLAPESDEEKPDPQPAPDTEPASDTSPEAGGKSRNSKDPKDPEGSKAPPETRFDPEGLASRILALPLPAGAYADLAVGTAGQLFYRRAPTADADSQHAVFRYDLAPRKETRLLEHADSLEVVPGGKRALLRIKEALHLVDLGDKPDLSRFKIDLDRVRVRVDPPSEWAQIFHEAWRINRDFFYDPGFHGANWPAMRARYEAFLPHLTSREDLFRVIQWMLSELAVGHSYQSPGDRAFPADTIPVGLLGADYEITDGRYRFRKVFGGLNWNPDLRSPLTEPGVNVREGEYLLAVAGRDLHPPDNLYRAFERLAGRPVEITVGPNPDGTHARTVRVVPLESELALRNRDWVEGNLRRVTEATAGRVAYVYVPNTAALGHTYFKRYFFPQADREAIIVDERHNGGGLVADYYIDILRRPVTARWAMRYGPDLKTPIAGIHGPKVMLIDETAGSGGDLLPWMFRQLELGPLIGRRTWGGLVGILGFPVLMDGGRITAPNLAFWNKDGFGIENEGVAPDIEVEQTPKEVIAGRDPQLETAIQVILQQLAESPTRHPVRPPFPVRTRPALSP